MLRLFLALVLFVAVTSPLETRAENESQKKYSLLDHKFITALETINSSAFFTPPLQLPDLENLSQQSTEGIKRVKALSYVAGQYSKRGESICSEIIEGYNRSLKKNLSGQKAYDFDNQLIQVMRDFGATPLPLRVFNGQGKITYKNPEWENASTRYHGNEAFAHSYDQLPGNMKLSVKYDEGGIIKVNPIANENGGNYMNFRFIDELAKQHGLTIEDYELSFDFVQPFVFVFRESSKVEAETISFYVDLSFTVESDMYGLAEKIKKTEESKKFRQSMPKCYVLSTAILKLRQVDRPRFEDGEKFLSHIARMEPLTFPIRDEYAQTLKVKEIGKSGLVKAGEYSVDSSEISEPSLECWMTAMGYAKGSPVCNGTGYAKEFLDVLNDSICVSKEIKKRPQVSYPLKISPRNTGLSEYIGPTMPIENSCN